MNKLRTNQAEEQPLVPLRLLSCTKMKCKELLDLDKKDEYMEMLEEFFEAWITNPQSDGTPANRRANYLTRYKELRKFILTIPE